MILSTFTTRDLRMDRGNRTIAVASTLLAPAWLALAMLVLSDQAGFAQTANRGPGYDRSEPARVIQADLADDSRGGANDGGVQQVAGGLLQALAGRGSSNQSTHHHANSSPHSVQNQNHAAHHHSTSNSPGFLGGLFGGFGSSEDDSSTGKAKSEYRVVTPMPDEDRGPVDWTGVPFHQAQPSKVAANSAPIRDPRTTRDPSPALRDYNGPTTPIVSRSAQSSSTASARRAIPAPIHDFDSQRDTVDRPRSSAPVETSISSRTVAVTPPPKTSGTLATEKNSLSTDTSSRRSDRRSVEALDASEIAAAARANQNRADAFAPSTLAPKVARREVPSADTMATAKSPTLSKPATAKLTPAKPEPAKPMTAKPLVAKSSDLKSSDLESSDAQPTAAPAQVVKPLIAKLTPSAPAATLAAPKLVAKSLDSQPYRTPADPVELTDSDEHEPLGSVPAVPYAASSPDPRSEFTPASEFQPRGTVVSSRNPAGAGSATFRTASSVPTTDKTVHVPSGEILSLSRETSERIAQGPNGQAAAPMLAPLRSSTATSETIAASTPPSLAGADPLPPMNTHADAPLAAVETTTPKPAATSTGESDKTSETTHAIEPNRSAVASELPGIRVETFGPSQIMIRQSHPYEIRIENRGAINASGVVVRANIPSWAEVQGSSASRGDVEASTQSGQVERLVWKIDQLPAGATERMFVRLKAVRSGTHDMDVDWTLAPQKSVSKVFVQEPKIAITIDGPDEVVYGQSRTYKVRISNPGDGTAPNVMFTLSPNSATPQTQRIGDIPAGKEAQIEIELTAQDLGDLNINGLAAGDLELRAEGTKTIRVASAKLQATLSGPQVKYQNTESIYRLELKNAGTATSEKVVASLRLPVGVEYLGGLELAQQRADTLQWTIDALAPDEVREYQFKCNMIATGDQMFAFDCKGSAAGQADVGIATRVEAIADLVLTVDDPPAPAPVNEEVTYEIVIRNRGSKEAKDVYAVAQFSLGVEPQRVEGHAGQLLTGQVIFEVIPRIGPGEQIVLRVIAKAASAGHHRFRAEVTSADTVLVAEEATHYMSPQTDRVSRHSDDKVQK